MEKNRDNEREFRLRPRKPAARDDGRVHASAYKIIMHRARMSGVRRRRVLGFGTANAQSPLLATLCGAGPVFKEHQ